MAAWWEDPVLMEDIVTLAKRILADTDIPAADTSRLESAISDLEALVPPPQ